MLKSTKTQFTGSCPGVTCHKKGCIWCHYAGQSHLTGAHTKSIYQRTPRLYGCSNPGDTEQKRPDCGHVPGRRHGHCESKVPVAEMFGFAGDIRSAAEGRCLWSTESAGFERLPRTSENHNKGDKEEKRIKSRTLWPRPLSGIIFLLMIL